jgi:hypothetical protein
MQANAAGPRMLRGARAFGVYLEAVWYTMAGLLAALLGGGG